MMKIRFTIAAIMTIIGTAISANVKAQAGEAGGARFHFAPNVWKSDTIHNPVPAEPVHTVKNGSMPAGASFLGLEAQLLTKPTPEPQTQVAARPMLAQPLPQSAMPKADYSPAFGMPSGMTASQQKGSFSSSKEPEIAQSKASFVHNIAHHKATKNVHAQLKSKPSGIPNGAVANLGKPIDSYGEGYVPGSFLPTTAGCGLNAQASVHGRVLK